MMVERRSLGGAGSEVVRKSNIVGMQAHITGAPSVDSSGIAATWNSVDNDPLGMIGDPASSFIVPESGLWDISMALNFGAAAGSKAILAYVNAVPDLNLFHVAGAVQGFTWTALDVPFAAGDTVAFSVSSATTTTMAGCRMSVRRSGDPFG